MAVKRSVEDGETVVSDSVWGIPGIQKEADAWFQSAVQAIGRDTNNLLESIVEDLSDHDGYISGIDPGAGDFRVEARAGAFRVCVHCHRIEWGMARVWELFREEFKEPALT